MKLNNINNTRFGLFLLVVLFDLSNFLSFLGRGLPNLFESTYNFFFAFSWRISISNPFPTHEAMVHMWTVGYLLAFRNGPFKSVGLYWAGSIWSDRRFSPKATICKWNSSPQKKKKKTQYMWTQGDNQVSLWGWLYVRAKRIYSSS